MWCERGFGFSVVGGRAVVVDAVGAQAVEDVTVVGWAVLQRVAGWAQRIDGHVGQVLGDELVERARPVFVVLVVSCEREFDDQQAECGLASPVGVRVAPEGLEELIDVVAGEIVQDLLQMAMPTVSALRPDAVALPDIGVGFIVGIEAAQLGDAIVELLGGEFAALFI